MLPSKVDNPSLLRAVCWELATALPSNNSAASADQQGWAWVVPTFSIPNAFCASAKARPHAEASLAKLKWPRIFAYASSAEAGSLAFTRANKPPVDFVTRKRLMSLTEEIGVCLAEADLCHSS